MRERKQRAPGSPKTSVREMDAYDLVHTQPGSPTKFPVRSARELACNCLAFAPFEPAEAAKRSKFPLFSRGSGNFEGARAFRCRLRAQPPSLVLLRPLRRTDTGG